MRKSIEQSIKRWLKRKISITFGVIVAFLLGSIGTYGADILIGWDSGTDKIKVELDGESIVDGEKVKVDGKKIIFSKDFSHSGQITFDDSVFNKGISIENSGTVNSSTGDINTNFNSLGNGIDVYKSSDTDITILIESLKNSGVICGIGENISGDNNNIGNGIGVYSFSNISNISSTIKNLENNEVISGMARDIVGSFNNGGNGVGIYSFSRNDNFQSGLKVNSSIVELINTGRITGMVKNINNSDNNNDNNIGNGIGIYASVRSTSTIANSYIENLENTGVITGLARDIVGGRDNNGGNGVGIYSYDYFSTAESIIDNLNNTGLIIGIGGNLANSCNNVGNGMGIYSYGYSGKGIINIKEKINNSGVIIGIAEEIKDFSNNSGNGVALYSYGNNNGTTSSIENLENSGIITGLAGDIVGNFNNGGNGIGIYSNCDNNIPESLASTLTNSGTIAGIAKSIDGNSNSGGNGIALYSYSNGIRSGSAMLSTFKNSGTISGMVEDVNGDSNKGGNGVTLYSEGQSMITNFINGGVIAGKNSGVSVINSIGLGSINSYSNYGIVAGQTPVDANIATGNSAEDFGLAIILDDKGYISKVEAGSGKDATNPTAEHFNTWAVVNTDIKGIVVDEGKSDNGIPTDFSGNTDTLMSGRKNSFTIINGALVGVNVNNKAEFSNVIINSYGEAVVFSGSGNSFKGTDVIINGGGLRKGANDSDIAVRAYEKEGSKFELAGKSIVNGDISMKGKSNEIVLNGRDIILNGDIEMDPLSGSSITFANSNSTNDTLAISSEIYGAGTININENVTFFEQVTREVDDGQGGTKVERVTGADIEGVGKINIGANGVMNIRLGEAENNIVTNHALNTSTSTLTTDTTVNISDNGQLKFVLNGNGAGTIIDLGSTKLGDSVKDGTEVKAPNIGATSKYHTVIKDKDNLNNLIVEVASKLPPIVDPPVDPPVDPDPKPEAPNFADYQYLNKIYQSITSSKQDGVLTDVDSDEKYIQSLQFFSDIFGANPYGYSAEISRRTMEMQEKVVLRKDLYPELHKWAIYGGLTHIDGGSEERFYGKGVKTLDVGSRDIEADSKITGGYMLAEYKYSDSLVLGTTLGGSSSDTDVLHSKVEGDAVYLGGYAKKYSGNLRTTLGVGVHYGDYEADRVGVRYWNGTKDSYSENYNDLGLSIYGDIRYSLPLDRGFFLEPHITLSYTHIEQDGVDEGGKELAIETDDKEFNYTNLRTGVDLKKVITGERAKHTVAVGVAYDRLLDGYDEEYITGRMKGGSSFDILTTRGDKHSLSVNGRYEVEFENGVVFDVVGEYSFERNTHHSGSRSTSKGEWTVGGGIGYKF